MSSTATLPVTSPIQAFNTSANSAVFANDVEIAREFGHDPADSFGLTQRKRPALRDCVQEFGSRVGLLPRMPVRPEIGAVGSGSSALGGAAIGFVTGTILWGALGIPSLAVDHNNRYHSDLRGILFLAIGIPAFTIIGAIIGATVGGSRSKD